MQLRIVVSLLVLGLDKVHLYILIKINKICLADLLCTELDLYATLNNRRAWILGEIVDYIPRDSIIWVPCKDTLVVSYRYVAYFSRFLAQK